MGVIGSVRKLLTSSDVEDRNPISWLFSPRLDGLLSERRHSISPDDRGRSSRRPVDGVSSSKHARVRLSSATVYAATSRGKQRLFVGAVDAGSCRGASCRGGVLGRAVAAFTCAVVLAGCGGGATNAGSQAALLTTLENWSALETPVDQARGILTQQCMAQHGLRYYPFAQAGQPGASPFFAARLFGSALWLGPQSLAWRAVNGWGLYQEMMQQLSQRGGLSSELPAEFRVMQSLRGPAIQAYMKALWGGGKTMKIKIPGLPGTTIQIGGCSTIAGKQLFGSVAASVAVPQYGQAILNGSIQSAASRSPALRVSEASWAACVRAGTGLAVTSPRQLYMHFFILYHTKGPTPAVHDSELKAAVTDLNCQRRSRLPQTLQQAAVGAVGHLPSSVLAELQTLVAVLDQARARASAVFAHEAKTPNVAAPNGGAVNGGGAIGSPLAPGRVIQGRSVVVFGG